MEAGADVNKARNNGATPLLMAAQFGNETLVRALIKAGADVNRASNEGVTPLFVAAGFDHETVVRVLIELGADINKAAENGGTPLRISMTPVLNTARGNHAAVVQILKDKGAV
jgi:ankyrin repeat protein